jgi:hypothetical protein
MYSFRILAGTPAIRTEVLCGVTRSFPKNARISLPSKSSSNSLLTNHQNTRCYMVWDADSVLLANSWRQRSRGPLRIFFELSYNEILAPRGAPSNLGTLHHPKHNLHVVPLFLSVSVDECWEGTLIYSDCSHHIIHIHPANRPTLQSTRHNLRS